jgi:O-succinylbenzoic acid--CoA ligase
MSGVSSLRPVSGTAAEIYALLREWDAAPFPDPLVIATSGSTGQPKRVMLSRDAMRASALATQERLGGPGQWVLNLPPTYVAGVQVLYRSVVAGTEPVTEIEELSGGRGYISLVPTQLIRLLRDRMDGTRDKVDALTVCDAVLIGGGPLHPAVRAEAESAGLRIVQTYGMSETCGGCVYDGYPLPGVEVGLGADGEVLLRGTMLFEGYEGEPERTTEVLRDGWFHTDDLGTISPDGRLSVTGRADDVIISGGVNVPASAVASALSADDAVRAVEVLGVDDDEWGQRVVAFVAPNDPITLAGLRELVEPREWAPRQLVLVEEIPRLPNGKVDRVALKAMA